MIVLIIISLIQLDFNLCYNEYEILIIVKLGFNLCYNEFEREGDEHLKFNMFHLSLACTVLLWFFPQTQKCAYKRVKKKCFSGQNEFSLTIETRS